MAAGSGGRSRPGARGPRTGPGPAGSGRSGERGEAPAVSGRKDPFPGSPPLPRPRVKRFLRGGGENAPRGGPSPLRRQLRGGREREEEAATRAARSARMLEQEGGFLEAPPGQATCTITQGDIAEAADIASAAKHFELRLEQFGPYRLDYTRDGRFLLLGGRRGHVAALDWESKSLSCEFNVLEPVRDVAWLHTEALLAVAQRRWLHVYDNQGLELNCLKSFPGVLRLQFLPYHFLLATASESGFLQYLDVSVGQEVATIGTRGGRLGVMAQNPQSAVIHLGHSNGTVTLWSPKSPEPLARILCHRGALRGLDIDPGGTLMASSGLDRRLVLWDLRTLRALGELLLPGGAGGVVYRRGWLARKVLAEAEGKKTPWGRRGWKPFHSILKGTTLYFLKPGGRPGVPRRLPTSQGDPDPFLATPGEEAGGGRRGEPTTEAEEPLGLHHALAERATQYTKRPNVFRLQTADRRLFLFQAPSLEEMFSWISRLNLVAALFSAPPFPAAVGSRRRFVRPVLPAAPSRSPPEEQLRSHEEWMEQVAQELLEHQRNLPEKRGRELEEYQLKKEHLLYERRRYETYVQVLETWLTSGAQDLARWEAQVGPVVTPPDPPTLTKAHSSPSLVPDPPNVPNVRVKRNISERRTVRKIVPKRNKNLL